MAAASGRAQTRSKGSSSGFSPSGAPGADRPSDAYACEVE